MSSLVFVRIARTYACRVYFVSSFEIRVRKQSLCTLTLFWLRSKTNTSNSLRPTKHRTRGIQGFLLVTAKKLSDSGVVRQKLLGPHFNEKDASNPAASSKGEICVSKARRLQLREKLA